MTVTTELARKSFPWTGVETAFACGFAAEDVSHLRVFFTTTGGITSGLTMGVNYSASLASGSKIVTVLPILIPAAAGTVTVERRTPALVTEVLEDGQDFSLEVIQRMHDRAMMIAAEYRTVLSRAIVLEDGSEGGSGAYDMGGNRLSNVGAGLLPNDAATIAQLQGIGGAQGNVPLPVLGQVGFALFALAPGVFGWLAVPGAADGAITNVKLARMASGTVKGRLTAGDGQPEDLNQAQLRTLLGLTTPGLDLVTAVSKAAQRAALQITAAGEALILADLATQRLLLGVIPDAPADGKPYARKDSGWDEIEAAGVTDTDRRSLVLAHERASKALGARQAIFGGTVDGFAATDGINAGASANYTHDAGNKRVTPSFTVAAKHAVSAYISASGTVQIAAAFDGVTSQAVAACAYRGTVSDAYFGADFATSPKTVAYAKIFGSNNSGYVNSANPNIVATLYGKTGAAPSSGTDGTSLGSVSFADTANESTARTIASSNATTAWNYIWVNITQDGGTVNNINMAELELYPLDTVSALSLVTATQTVDTAPASIRVGILVDLTETITSADFTAEATRTGAAWALGTLSTTKIGGNLWYYEAVIDVSGQASGTSVAARLKTANGKSLRILAVSVEVVV